MSIQERDVVPLGIGLVFTLPKVLFSGDLPRGPGLAAGAADQRMTAPAWKHFTELIPWVAFSCVESDRAERPREVRWTSRSEEPLSLIHI